MFHHRPRDPPVLELGLRSHFLERHFVLVLDALSLNVFDRFLQNLEIIFPL